MTWNAQLARQRVMLMDGEHATRSSLHNTIFALEEYHTGTLIERQGRWSDMDGNIEKEAKAGIRYKT